MFYHSKRHEATARKEIHSNSYTISNIYKSRVISNDERIEAEPALQFIGHGLCFALVPEAANVDAVTPAVGYIDRADMDLGISRFEPSGQGLCMIKVRERRGLDSEIPISARPSLVADDRQLHLIRSLPNHAERSAGSVREVHDALPRKRPAIVDADLHTPSRCQRSHLDNRAKRQGPMRRGHFMHVEPLAAGGFIAMESRAIPRRDTLFTMSDGITARYVADGRRSSTGGQDEEETEDNRRCERAQD